MKSLSNHGPSDAPAWAIIPSYIWLVGFVLLPLLIVSLVSFVNASLGVGPSFEIWERVAANGQFSLTGENYRALLTNGTYVDAALNSVVVATVTTLLCLIIGYPMAYAIARAPLAGRQLLLILFAALFCTSALVRTYAWTVIFDSAGPVNEALQTLGLIREPLAFHGAVPTVYLGMVYAYLPVMVLAIYLSLLRLDYSLVEAARDLGARTGRIFLLIIVPVSLPGAIVGCLLVFIPASGEFAVPWLLGGKAFPAVGTAIWTEFFIVQDWPRAAAMVALLLLALVVPTVFLFKAALMPVIQATPRQQNGPIP